MRAQTEVLSALPPDTPTQLALVDVSSASNASTQTYFGVADRSARGLAFLLLTTRTRTLRRSGVQSVAVAVPVRAAGEDANHAGAGPLGGSVLREAGDAGTVHGLGEGAGELDVLGELAGGEQSGVTGELAG
jgi:hypothetical protein